MIEIPWNMSSLPRDGRGLPIPYMVFRDENGIAHFTINDEVKRQRVIQQNLCSLCGMELPQFKWMVGGPMSAFHEDGIYLDPPVHRECGQYALRVCPYLAAPNYSKRIDAKTLRARGSKLADAEGIFTDPTIIPERPDFFVAVLFEHMTGIADTINNIPYVRALKPDKPYKVVEFWRHGVQVVPPAALAVQAIAAMREGGSHV